MDVHEFRHPILISEFELDGAIHSLSMDGHSGMGIAGTANGTVWAVNVGDRDPSIQCISRTTSGDVSRTDFSKDGGLFLTVAKGQLMIWNAAIWEPLSAIFGALGNVT